MMFQVGDDGVVSSVNEEDLIYVDKNELEQFIESYHKLEKENEQLKSKNRGLQSELQIFKEDVTYSNLQINKLADENEQLKKELESFRPIIFESDGKPVTLYKKGGDVE